MARRSWFVRFLAATSLVTVGCRDDRPVTAPIPVAFAQVDTVGDYEVSDLGSLGGGATVPNALNDSGDVVGQSMAAEGFFHAFHWKDGVMTDIHSGDPFGASRADVVSAGGLIAGMGQPEGDSRSTVVWTSATSPMVPIGPREPPHGGMRVFEATKDGELLVQHWEDHSDIDSHTALWRDGVWQDLGPFPPTISGVRGWARNAARRIVGVDWVGERDGTNFFRAFQWTNGTFEDLGSLGMAACPDFGPRECYNSEANDINGRGEVVGTSSDSTSFRIWRPVRWRHGKIELLAAITGRAIAINNRGMIAILGTAGFVFDGHSYVWEDGVLQDIGSLGGGGTIIRAMNEQGAIVGYSQTAAGETHAFVWENGVMTDLGTGPAGSPNPHSIATAINERGDIIGTAGTCQPDGRGGCSMSIFEGSRGLLWRRLTTDAVIASNQ